jgi:hypothetical protein
MGLIPPWEASVWDGDRFGLLKRSVKSRLDDTIIGSHQAERPIDPELREVADEHTLVLPALNEKVLYGHMINPVYWY